ncbi:hypothetical protein FM036_29580 [Nostoc sp. HG1]|nr:hypothetical protein [Nostoc sp. HG1]
MGGGRRSLLLSPNLAYLPILHIHAAYYASWGEAKSDRNKIDYVRIFDLGLARYGIGEAWNCLFLQILA